MTYDWRCTMFIIRNISTMCILDHLIVISHFFLVIKRNIKIGCYFVRVNKENHFTFGIRELLIKSMNWFMKIARTTEEIFLRYFLKIHIFLALYVSETRYVRVSRILFCASIILYNILFYILRLCTNEISLLYVWLTMYTKTLVLILLRIVLIYLYVY